VSANLLGQFLPENAAAIILMFVGAGRDSLQRWRSETWKNLLWPGGVLLLAAAISQAGWMTLPSQSLTFLYYCALCGGMLLAWRFHSSRTAFALLVLFAAQQTTALVRGPRLTPGSRGWIVLEIIAMMLPLNFVVISLMQERGFTASSTTPVFLLLFIEFVFVTVLYRSAENQRSAGSHAHHWAVPSWPGYVWFLVIASCVFLLARSLLTRKPIDCALFWSLCAAILSIRPSITTHVSAVYSAAAAIMLAASIIENSYLLAYHDELTTLPSRRALNDALLCLQHPYSIAVVDIDHFKRFNDTYGHHTGDQVLRLVAAKLSRVTGGGQAFRCGGEEFAILFAGKSGNEVLDHLDQLRRDVERCKFRLRGAERRQVVRGPDRRNVGTRKGDTSQNKMSRLDRDQAAELSVTISIGLGWSNSTEVNPDFVLQAADKALYRAKANGRNRVEAMAMRRLRVKSAGIA
jgi:diguanylate cyclase (GGDEF)-like protein